MKSVSPAAKRLWKRRMARDLGLYRVTSLQRSLLNQLWELQRALDAFPVDGDVKERLSIQRTYMGLVNTLRSLKR
jgi:hypothetical protein